MDNAQEKTLLNSFGDEFFTILEKDLQIKIPLILRNILYINDIDCAQVLSRVDDEAVHRIEDFMKKEFTATMIPGNDTQMMQYLGKYEFSQQKFNFSSGHKIILKMIIEHCAKCLSVASALKPTPSSGSQEEDSASENLNQSDSETADAVRMKTTLINLLFQSLFSWIKNHAAFTQVFHATIKTIIRNLTDTQKFSRFAATN
jgi:hypothetical protein